MVVRTLVRVVAAAALAAIGVGGAASPSHAADIDFVVETLRSRFLVDGPAQPPIVVRNRGTVTPESITVRFDARNLDARIELTPDDGCTVVGRVAECAFAGDRVPESSEPLYLTWPLTAKNHDKVGDQGSLIVTVLFGGNENSLEVGIDLAAGPDLSNVVVNLPELRPGTRTTVDATYENHGDAASTGVITTIELPAGLTFAEKKDAARCAYNAAMTEVRCVWPDVLLMPISEGPSELMPAFPVRVSDNAKGTSVGRWTVDTKNEVDPSDNTEEIKLVVAAAPGGAGAGAGGGTSGDEPTLPITGPSATIGIAFLILGALMVLAGRKRRIEGVR